MCTSPWLQLLPIELKFNSICAMMDAPVPVCSLHQSTKFIAATNLYLSTLGSGLDWILKEAVAPFLTARAKKFC